MMIINSTLVGHFEILGKDGGRGGGSWAGTGWGLSFGLADSRDPTLHLRVALGVHPPPHPPTNTF